MKVRNVFICRNSASVFLESLCGLLWLWSIVGILLSVSPSFNHQAVANPLQESEAFEILVLSVKGQVTLYRSTESVGRGAAHERLMYGDRLVTGASSEATLQFADRTVGRVDELTELWIQPSGGNWGGSANWEGSPYVIEIPRGGFYLLNREQALNQSIWTPAASGEILGTEVVFRVNGDGTTHAVMYEGQVRISNEWGEVVLGPMEESTATLGRAPSRLPLLEMVAPIQWTYYYPAVLDLDELALPEESLAVLAESLKAYRTGDLNVAVLKLPEGWNSPDEGDRVYRAALAMAAGQVEKVEQLLQGNASLTAEALRRLISAVQGQAGGVQSANGSASLALAESYVAQSSLDLPGALEFARSATALNPHFAFAQARVAELEFGMGRVDPAREALEKARRISPRHAPSLALEGFMAMSQHRYLEARSWMDAALEIDGDYGDAWLGRGLLRIRHGDVVGGRQDLQVAVALQPTRSVTRSYLAKAYALEGDVARAENEIQRARELDFFDATSWLYGAMLKQQQSRFNEAIEDLELSKNLNERRAVFRSTHLLDQDLAMRGANLAAVYKDGGLLEWSAREAARGISYDYADGASHQFLANSFDNLRDVQGYNPRYQAPWFNQLMLANLLSPVGAGTLSQSISQQEYSQFFGRERLGISSYTEYFSRGNWIQRGSHYGTLGGLSYALDVDYLKQNGFVPNTDQERLNLYGKFKQQLGEKDQLFVQMQYGRHEGGDWLQYFDPHQARSTFRYRSRQDPNLYIGWHREWSPTQRTLFLLGHLQNRMDFTDASAVIPLIQRSNPSAPPHTIQLENAPRYQLDHQSEFKGWSVEGQHIARVREHTLIGGIRWQTGESRRSTTQEAVPGQPLLDGRFSPRSQEVRSNVGLLSVYAYDIWELRDSMHLTAGLSYDWAEFPLNEDMAPLTGEVGRRERLSPRLGWQWSPSNNTHLRAAWTRSLGGSSPGNPARLEPVHIAGFTQAYAALTPESLTGLVPGLALETVHLGMDRKFRSRTFVGLVAEYLRGTGQRSLGAYDLTASPFQELEALSLSQRLRYEERTVYLTVNQLLGESWSLGGGYRYSEGDLKLNYDVAHAGAGGELNQDLQSTLHRWDVWGQYAHSSGFFAQVVGRWNLQSNSGLGHSGDENFWQMDLYAGYRWWQRRVEARIGLLNVTDQDYRLSPLNVREEYPRQRMIYGSFRFQF